jgi:poly-gamma-glutamate synthesis protein (capsule biosynthesis protein)
MYRVGEKRSPGWAKILIVASVLLAVSILCFIFVKQPGHKLVSIGAITKSEPKPEPVKSVELKSKLLFMGDVFWGRYINDWSQASKLKEAYPFSGLKSFHRDDYDAWVANEECPSIREAKPLSSAQQDALLSFNCSPSYLPEAKKWFTAFSLANNHTDNRGGRSGLDETRQHLKSQSIQYFGDFNPEQYDDVCEVLAMPVQVGLSDNTTKTGKLPMTFCGYHGVFKIPSDKSLGVMKQYARLMPVFAFPHAGVEYKPVQDTIKTTLYRKMIDNGADAVFGAHPHWVQPAESYKGHLIVYSMGNFIFDQQANAEVSHFAAIQLNLELNNADSDNLDKWLALGETCATFHDDCLAQAKQQGLQKLPLSYEFGAIAGDDTGRVTHLASKDQLTKIKQRLGWQTVAKKLQSPYSAKP